MYKKLLLFVAAVSFLWSTDIFAKKGKEYIETPASDSRVEYTGRVVVNGDEVAYDWSGVYFRVKFNGPYLAMKCSDSKNSWFNLWVDKEMSNKEDRKFIVAAKDTLIVLAEGLGKGQHEVILQKRTEGEQGRFTVHSFLSEGEIVQAQGRKGRHIEFIGDSYTCGYGTESKSGNDPFLPETENCNLTYAAIAARYFNADFNLISHSGQGICRNYDDYRPGYNMPDRYAQAFDESTEIEWNPQMSPHGTPDMVVIYLCTNDFSTARQPHEMIFANRYIELLKKVRAFYGNDIPILCMASNVTPFSFDYIRNACIMSGLEGVSYMGVTKDVHNNTTDLGASAHPNYRGQLKVASNIIPYISTLTGWEMEEKAYK
ncbi:MAG: GDSL family lipase [Bacteroidales bacterium]|nr:GDSL family lipase [Bacteroidales bacterium]